MGFLNKLLFKSKLGTSSPKIQFGRYSDSYKDEIKYDAWDKALNQYEAGNHLESYRLFFEYLMDEDTNNVILEENRGQIHFTFYQGSKLISGVADSRKVTAEAKIATINAANIGVFRKLLEENYQLKYSRYAIDGDQNLTILFSTYSIDGSPYKLYYALKELATTADATDDVLVSKYDHLQSINNHHIRDVSDEEKRVKHQFLLNAVSEAIEAIDSTSLNISQHPGAISYIYLDLIFKLDYLLKPEGNTMDAISSINKMYFKDKVKSTEQKNLIIGKRIRALSEISYEDFCNEVYEVNSTFGITSPSSQNRIVDFIKGEIENMDWYQSNGHLAFALAIPSYIAGYSLYSYSMPKPMKALLEIFYRVTEYPYFIDLGYHDKFVDISSKSISSRSVKTAVKKIVSNYGNMYDQLSPNMQNIRYDDICNFSKDYLLMIAELDFTRKDQR